MIDSEGLLQNESFCNSPLLFHKSQIDGDPPVCYTIYI